ncbi:DUF4249 domain-containing protein [Arsenicibacter rosenii]|uniref:DUF4249 domain-containing protein n=1 Tax=Arsenicibacter rosenii TaxID=1750698 RepID=A0A1S2VN49_9BACT|nr:DUF4249 domain-containing protein [Arsenicibacter rosenii]OIN60189.1 hypothetical protein BLX24_04965 [Arsenicibacter rosenii]
MIRYLILNMFAGLVLFMTGCGSLVQDVPDAKVPQESEKPVVISFISPQDSLLAVSVQLTRTVLGTYQSGTIVSNAVVTIADGNRFIALPYVQGSNGIYAAPARNFPLQAGKTYTLSVKMPSRQELSSSATIPENTPIQSVVIDSAVAVYNGSQPVYRYTAQLKWKDVAGQADYYRIRGDQVITRVVTGPNTQTQTASYVTAVLFDNRPNRYLITDLNQDGQLLTSAKGLYVRFAENTTGQPVGPANTVNLYLLHTDKLYYDYHNALKNYSESDGNPFAEPVLLPNNIQGGGLGCFAAFNQSVVRFTPK